MKNIYLYHIMGRNETQQDTTRQYNRYENTNIYKLIHPESGYYYIGSTCDRLSKRLCAHKSAAKSRGHVKVYKAFNELGWLDVKIILIQEHYLENNEQKLRAENDVIMANIHDDKCLNSIRAWTSLEETRERHKEYIKENPEKIAETRKIYNSIHKEQLREAKQKYVKDNPEKVKQWKHNDYERRKNEIKITQKQYYENNKEKIRVRNNKIELCCCGCTYTHQNKLRHESSKKHQAWLHDKQQTAETI